MKEVQEHYERFPYPPIPSAALPRRGQGKALSLKEARARVFDAPVSKGRERILVVGAGTLEALVVGLANPRASELVALDLSARSISRLKRRVALARARQWLLGLGVFQRVPNIRFVVGDVATWEGGEFDLIVASNVLHHHTEPGALLGRLASWLAPNGLLRLVTYPAASRFWLRASAAWLRAGGLRAEDDDLVKASWARIAELDKAHPIRLSFESNYESKSAVGIADAYFHPCENPLRPHQWRQAAERAGLELVLEDQHPYSRSTFVDEVVPALAGMNPWDKLQLLDDLHELSTNPVLWFRQCAEGTSRNAPADAEVLGGEAERGVGLDRRLVPKVLADACLAEECPELWLPSSLQREMGEGLHRIASRLEGSGVSVHEVLSAFEREVGTHLSGADNSPLPGLAVHEHDGAKMMALPRPWPKESFQELGEVLGPEWSLFRRGGVVPGEGLAAQSEWLHLVVGAKSPWIGPLKLARRG